jgi:hypothetical protein
MGVVIPVRKEKKMKKKIGMLAFCDLLGFSNLVMENPLDAVLSQHDYLRRIIGHCLHQNGFPDRTPSLERLQNQDELGFAWFSDTMLFYGLDESQESNNRVVEAVAWLIFETMFKPEIRVRAGISFGEFFVDPSNGIYLGKALVEAYRLEQQQAWVGGALTFSAKEQFSDNNSWLVPYAVPIRKKNGLLSTLDTMAVDWTFGHHRPGTLDLNWKITSDEPTREEEEKEPKIIEKWRNTRKFHSEICTFCRV